MEPVPAAQQVMLGAALPLAHGHVSASLALPACHQAAARRSANSCPASCCRCQHAQRRCSPPAASPARAVAPFCHFNIALHRMATGEDMMVLQRQPSPAQADTVRNDNVHALSSSRVEPPPSAACVSPTSLTVSMAASLHARRASVDAVCCAGRSHSGAWQPGGGRAASDGCAALVALVRSICSAAALVSSLSADCGRSTMLPAAETVALTDCQRAAGPSLA